LIDEKERIELKINELEKIELNNMLKLFMIGKNKN
jgi:hypothetical protein